MNTNTSVSTAWPADACLDSTEAEILMRTAKSELLLSGGIVTGIAFVISCGDNWHLAADAAVDVPGPADAAPVCDCPAAEPPLAGRFVVVSNVYTIPANDRGIEGELCRLGTQLISGSCTVDSVTMRFNVSLEQTGTLNGLPYEWACAWRNYEPFPVRIRVSGVCLRLAP